MYYEEYIVYKTTTLNIQDDMIITYYARILINHFNCNHNLVHETDGDFFNTKHVVQSPHSSRAVD